MELSRDQPEYQRDPDAANGFGVALLAGLGIGILFWILVSAIEVVLIGQRDLYSELFHPMTAHLVIRVLVLLGSALFTITYARLLRSQRQLSFTQFVVDSSADAVFWISRDGRIKYANSAASRGRGYTPKELLGMSISDLSPMQPAETWAGSWEEIKQKKQIRLESIHRTKSGEIVPVEITATYTVRDNRELVCAVVRDISDRKLLEQELRNIQTTLTEAQRIAHLGSYTWNLKTGAAEFSDEIFRIYGREVGDKGFTLERTMDMIHPEDQARVRKTIEEDIRTKRPHSSEHRLVLANKTERWVHCQGEFILDNIGSPIRMLGTILDITESKKAERELKRIALKLREASKLKDLFNDVLSHDLMNPASAVKIASELLLKIETDPTKTKIISSIQRSTESLIDLCSNASKYARVSGAEQLEFAEYDLNTLLKRAIRDIGHLAAEKRIKINYDLKSEHFARVNLMITDVFLNLISNAIKYSPEGSVVDVDIWEEGDAWIISVGDQGEGIPDKYKDQIFIRFERIGAVAVKGTGLGLAIAKGIVDLHHGKIWVKDNAGKGSVFCVKLPKNMPLA